MDLDGQRGCANPGAMLTTLLSRRTKLQQELKNIERQVYDMETSYLQDPTQCGNVLKGFDSFLSASKSTALLKRSRKFQPDDRLFRYHRLPHLHVAAAPLTLYEAVNTNIQQDHAEEQAAARDDGRSDYGLGRSKGGGIYPNSQGKPKKGRGAGRDAKRIRPQSEVDYDYEDDPELTL